MESDHLQHLEKSILLFLSSFRRVYIEKSQIPVPCFARYKEKLGIDNLQLLTEMMIRKVFVISLFIFSILN